MIRLLQLILTRDVLPSTAPGQWQKLLLTQCSASSQNVKMDVMDFSITIPAIWNCNIKTVPPSAHLPSHLRPLKISWRAPWDINAFLSHHWATLHAHSQKLIHLPLWKAYKVNGGNNMARMPCGTATHANTFTKCMWAMMTNSVRRTLVKTWNHCLPLAGTTSTVMTCSLRLEPSTSLKSGNFPEPLRKDSQFQLNTLIRVALTMKHGISSKLLRDTLSSLTAHTWMGGLMLAASSGSDLKLFLLRLKWVTSPRFTRRSSTGTSQNNSARTNTSLNALSHQLRKFNLENLNFSSDLSLFGYFIYSKTWNDNNRSNNDYYEHILFYFFKFYLHFLDYK